MLRAEHTLDQGGRLIFVIGAGRSGTTLLADLLGVQPGLSVLMEKRYLWMYGAYWRPHDIRHAVEATPAVRAFVSHYLARRMQAARAETLIEKTPSNCFRVPFLAELFPRARFVHIIRDGRAVAYSAVRAFLGERAVTDAGRRSGRRGALQRLEWLAQRWPEVPRRLTEGDLPPSGWLPYVWRKSGEMFQALLTSKPPVWGARYPGIHADRLAYTPLEVAGIQWRESVGHALAGLDASVARERQTSLRYEQLVRYPRETIKDVLDFVGHRVDAAALDATVRRVKPERQQWREGLSEDECAMLYPHIVPMLGHLGYSPPLLSPQPTE